MDLTFGEERCQGLELVELARIGLELVELDSQAETDRNMYRSKRVSFAETSSGQPDWPLNGAKRARQTRRFYR